MKHIRLFAAIAAMAAFMACAKEELPVDPSDPQDEIQTGFVKMSFTAQLEPGFTKAYLSEKAVLWAGDESIAVFDHDNGGAAYKFDAESSGLTTSFSGTVPDGITHYTAVYPYSESLTYEAGEGSPVNAIIPSVQEATLGSFDPASAIFIATATSTDDKLQFTPAFALFKVNVDVDNVVQVSLSTTTNNLAGSVKVARSGNLSNGSGTLSKTIILKKSDNSVLAKGDYYIVTRFLKEGQAFENFTIKYLTSGALSNSRVSVSGVGYDKLVRKDILNLGSLSSIPGTPSVSWYEYYQAGYDISIGSKTINKATNGDAELLTADNVEQSIAKAKFEDGGVKFLKTVGTGSFSQTYNPTITNSSYFLADGDSRVPVAMTNVINLAEGALYLKGLSLSISGKTSILNVNKNTSGSMTDLVVDNCYINQNVASFVTTNSSFTAYGIQSIEFVNNSFAVSVDANIINVTSTYAGISVYSKFVFNNNYVYSVDGTNNHKTSAFAYSGSTGDQMEVEMNNNLFYNTAAAGTIKHNTLKKVTAKYNLVWTADASGLGANAKLFGMTSKTAIPTVDVANNAGYGTLATEKKWTIADATVNTGMDAIIVPESDPIASADTATGVFTMDTGYTAYGPQL
ncbi:MAG: hypothetical protein J6S97_02805 [Bacteroidales bacterium]|nr:hypothetical protein [Bacteroidales bacterium]